MASIVTSFNLYLIQTPTFDIAIRQRPRSEIRSKMSDDFWVKEVGSKEAEERARVRIELDNVRTSRQLFVEDCSR